MGRAGWCAPKLISWLLTAPAESGSAVHRCGGGQVADGEGQHDERLDQDHLELAVLCDVRAGDAAAADVPRPKLRASRTGRGDGRCANPHLLLLLPPLSSANRSVPAARTLSREAAFAIRSWARRVDLRIGCGLNADLRSHHLGEKCSACRRAVAMLCETKCMPCTLGTLAQVPLDSALEGRRHPPPWSCVSGRPVGLPELAYLWVSPGLGQRLTTR